MRWDRSTKAWTRVCVTVLASWIAAGAMAAAGERWQAVEQPDLKETLERAPALQTESLGEPARGVNVWERWLVPNPDGKSWDVLQIYFKEYYGPTWLYAIDLGTGRVTKQRLADGHQFYLSGRALGFDGKYYIATPSRKTWSMDLFVYDPATNTVEERGEIVPGLGGEVRPLVTGPDGRIYGTGTRGNQVGLYIYDPKLGKVVKDFGPVGPSHPNGAWSRYVMGVDDTHAYIASGMIPAWYLVAVDLASGAQKVLLEPPTERVMDIIESFPGAYARVPQDGSTPNREYWLYHGQAIPKTNDTPPWPKQSSPWDKAVPRPEVYFDQIDPDAQGNATLWYRSREDAAKAPKDAPRDVEPQALGWKSIRLEGVPSYPHRINPMSVLPDGRLYGTGDDYAGVFVFDPRTDQTTILGPRPGLAPYTQIVCDGKLYSSGYSGGHLFVYDPTQPWTLSIGGPPGHPASNQAAARSNPRYLGDFDKTTRVGLMHSSALGADGRIYFGGFGLRHYTGGGFGWYDPQTRKMDGFWEPLSGYAVHWIAPALEGRLIAISTVRAADERKDHRAPEEARLFVYDVTEQKIARQIVPIAKGRTTGLITEVTPGRLLGLTSDPQHSDGSILYGVDVTTGEVLFTKALPASVSIDNYWPHWVDPSYEYNAFVRGPDGFVWTYLKNVLVRIDPKDTCVYVVGKIDPVGWPTFIGNDVYLSGPEQLRRIRNLVPMRTSSTAGSPAPEVTVTIDYHNPSVVSQLEIGVTHTQAMWENGHPDAVARVKKLLEDAGIRYQNLHIMGWGANNPEPSSGVYSWSSLDRRLDLIRSMANTIPVITFCTAPGWMKASGRDWNMEERVADEHVQDFADLCRAVALRYRDVEYFQIWNEFKGYWIKGGRDVERFTVLYNAVYDAVQAARPDAKIGGPYLSMGGRSLSANDRQVLDYWCRHGRGCDFLTFDGWLEGWPPGGKTEDWMMSRTRFFGDLVKEFRAMMERPVWISEFYGGRSKDPQFTAANHASCYYHALQSGARLALLWDGVGLGQLFTRTQTAEGGRPTPHYAVVQALNQYFGPGTQLYQTKSSSDDIEALASRAKIMLINKRPESVTVRLEGKEVSFEGYGVRVLDAPGAGLP
jgi:outer membrane protein assembly factor BamB